MANTGETGIPGSDYAFIDFKSGTDVQMNVDGTTSDGAVDYTIGPYTEYKVQIERVNISIVDGGMGYGEFAGLNAALTNGIEILLLDTDSATAIDFTDGQNIKVNEDWALLAGADGVTEPAAGDDFMPIRWTLAKAGKPLLLGYGQVLRIRIQDSCSDISSFRAMAQGYYTDHSTL